MKADALAKLVEKASCRVFGHEDAGNDAHREVLAALIRGFDHPDATVLCEPSLARKTTRPPDCVLVDPVAGVHVVEVKGVTLDQIEAIEPGGLLAIRYGGLVNPPKNPVVQARNAMFDIRDAAARSCDGELVLPFKYWVVMPSIRRAEWFEQWGDDAFAPPELLFADDLPGLAETISGGGPPSPGESGPRSVARRPVRLGLAGLRRLLGAVPPARGAGGPACPGGHARRAVRRRRRGVQGPLRRAAAALGPGLDRAGRGWSGAWPAAARRSSWRTTWPAGSAGAWATANPSSRRWTERPRLLAVCYNRTLVPFIRQKIDIAFRQRTGRALPEDAVEVWHYNRLLWHLSRKGLWRYHKIDDLGDEERAGQYLAELEHVRDNQPDLLEAVAYDAIYVDEGQDFLEDDFRLL